MAGYLVKRIHPSSGTTTWQYDKAGNVIQQTLNSGESIRYLYNYNQLMEVRYSHRFWNDVYYQYGPAGSGNQTGRLVQQQDATGVQDFRYDAMGNVVGNRHTYVIPNNPEVFTLTTLWEYDSWGRIRNIIYPDREKVVYSYDRGGNLLDVSGVKAGQSNRYISRIEYNKYNQRISETKGNGIVTTYAYNPQNNRLTNLKEQSAVTNMIYQDVNYVYDGVGNITSISDNGLHSRTQSFSYDNINRLTNSDGNWDALQYNTELSYSKSGKILSKTMKSTRLNNIASLFQVDYDNNYYYSSYNPYAVKQIVNSSGDIEFHWDTKGNMIHGEDNIHHLRRDMCWTEDNRLQAFREYEENNIAAYYNYDANGERNLKFTSPRIRSSQNAAPFAQNPNLVFPTLYASSLITITKRGYTKHYFEEGKRICSKIGGGFALVDWNTITDKVPELTYGYDEQVEHQRVGIRETFGACMHADVIIDPHFNLFEMMQYQGIKDLTEYPFYYHSDHLGSATYLTDRIGNVIQTLTYLPYGEDWVDITDFYSNYNNIFDSTMLGAYSFNGKEKDSESDFHYYGARYYASELSTWLSTDPMSDKYPSLTPYNYCANNPVKLIDPNGEEIWIISSGGSKIVYSEGMQSINFDSYTAETINALNKLSSTKTIGLQIKQLSVNKNMMINVIENSNTTQAIVKTYIDATNTGSAYLTQDILFDAALGIENIFTGEILSPATALGHEFGHIISAIFDIKGFNRRNATKREDVWDTEEEFYNINTYELGIAKEWGELQRDGHNTMDKNGKEKYKTVKTKSSTSNEKIIE